MRVFLFFIVALSAGYFLLRIFLGATPAQLARLVRAGGGLAMLALAAFLAMRGLVGFGLALGALGLMTLMRSNWGMGQAAGAQTSQVRSAGLEMTLDHDSGEMDGQVLAGRFEGRVLSELAAAELLQLAEDFRGDEESLRLLESYLDRMHPGWRDDMDHGFGERPGPAASSGGMSAQEAYDILGLEPDASDTEIRAAHRRLIMQVHPDRGGSGALAAKINEAKDLLLGKHG